MARGTRGLERALTSAEMTCRLVEKMTRDFASQSVMMTDLRQALREAERARRWLGTELTRRKGWVRG